MTSLSLVLLLTLIEAVIVHVSIHVQILPGHKGEFCFWMLVWSIIRVITERRSSLVLMTVAFFTFTFLK